MILETKRFQGRVTILRICGLVLLVCALLGSAGPTEPAITTGSASGARDYYVRISKLFGFDAKPGITTLDDLLDFIGYPVSGAKVQALDSAILMDPIRASSPTEGLGVQTRGLGGATLETETYWPPDFSHQRLSTSMRPYRFRAGGSSFGFVCALTHVPREQGFSRWSSFSIFLLPLVYSRSRALPLIHKLCF